MTRTTGRGEVPEARSVEVRLDLLISSQANHAVPAFPSLSVRRDLSSHLEGFFSIMQIWQKPKELGFSHSW